MKRLVALLIAVTIFFALSSASALNGEKQSSKAIQNIIILENMSNDDLFSMYLEIQSVLLARSDAYAIKLDAGKYEVGKDIAPGSYRLECQGAYSSSQVKIFQSEDSKYPSDSYVLAELYNSSIVGRIELVNGNVLEISGSQISMTGYNPAQVEIKENHVVENAKSSDITDSFVVSPGKYKVGSEIPPGIYRIVCEEAYGFAGVNLYENDNSLFPSYDIIISKLFGNAEIGKIELKNGNYIEIAEGSVTFYSYDGVTK